MTLTASRNEAQLHPPVSLASLSAAEAYRILATVQPAAVRTIRGLLRNGYSPV